MSISERAGGKNLGPLYIQDKLVLDLNGEKIWIFHGDIFDITMKYSKWIAKIGSLGYEFLRSLEGK